MKPVTLRYALAAAVIATAAIGGSLVASGAFASETEGEHGACAVETAADGSKPRSLSDDELRASLATAGLTQVRSLGREDGCVEAKGLDQSGKRFEVYVHPATGQIVAQ
jgi:hypothetical protein